MVARERIFEGMSVFLVVVDGQVRVRLYTVSGTWFGIIGDGWGTQKSLLGSTVVSC